MSTYKDKLYFYYNGKSSKDFNIISVVTDNGMFEETLVADRHLDEIKIPKRMRPFFNRIEEESLEFDLTLAFDGYFDDKKIREVIEWLFQDYYKPLYFEGYENKIFYCLPIGSSNIIHNGLEQGYITITMRCDSPRVYGQIITHKFTKAQTPKTITINNDGSDEVKMFIKFTNTSAGNITITNNGYNVVIDKVLAGEEIIVDTEKSLVEGNVANHYHYNSLVGDISKLSLSKGTNKVNIIANADVEIYYRKQYRW